MEGKGFRLLTDLGGLKHSDDHHHGTCDQGKRDAEKMGNSGEGKPRGSGNFVEGIGLSPANSDFLASQDVAGLCARWANHREPLPSRLMLNAACQLLSYQCCLRALGCARTHSSVIMNQILT